MKNNTDLTNENIIHVSRGGISYLQFRRLNEYPELFHMITLKPLDFASNSTMEVKKETAQRSLELVRNELCAENADFLRPCQTHSDHIRKVRKNDAGIYPDFLADTDGLISDIPGKAMLLGFGDCTPLLFYDPVKKAAANIHSGWRGTLLRIGYKSVTEMVSAFESCPEDLICCIGPHIRQCHFEVDRDVYELFATEFTDLWDFDNLVRIDRERDKYYIDTAGINKRLLQKAGLKDENVIDCGICTVCRSDVCHSYRAEKADSGRMAAVLGIRG